jgi:hypothetical protein
MQASLQACNVTWLTIMRRHGISSFLRAFSSRADSLMLSIVGMVAMMNSVMSLFLNRSRTMITLSYGAQHAYQLPGKSATCQQVVEKPMCSFSAFKQMMVILDSIHPPVLHHLTSPPFLYICLAHP